VRARTLALDVDARSFRDREFASTDVARAINGSSLPSH
jgi:hypothetical protein